MPETDIGPLIELCRLIVPDDASLQQEVALAAANPSAYLNRLGDRLDERGITDVRYVDPRSFVWLAVIDGLQVRKRCVEIDWKAEPDDVMWSLDQLQVWEDDDPERWAWVDRSQWAEASTEDFLCSTHAHLLSRGLHLAYMDIDSDSYPLVLLSAADFAEASALSEKAGYGRIVSLQETP